MVVHYIYFPQIKADMAESRHPTLARRPIALIRGVGGDAIVTARTSTAARLGVLVGMSAGSAQARAPRCAFLPDREDEEDLGNDDGDDDITEEVEPLRMPRNPILPGAAEVEEHRKAHA